MWNPITALATDSAQDGRRLPLPAQPLQAFSKVVYSSASDVEINRLATGCEVVAAELLEALDGLRLGGKKTTWRSMIQALKTVRSEGKISTVRARLEEYRMGIHTALLVSLR